MEGVEDTRHTQRNYLGPYTPKNPIPTIQHYQEVKQQRRKNAQLSRDDTGAGASEDLQEENQDPTYDLGREELDGPYKSRNLNIVNASASSQGSKEERDANGVDKEQNGGLDRVKEGQGEESRPQGESETMEDTSEMILGAQDPKQRRKAMKKRRDEGAERQVTDPVTHLPVQVHDFTGKDLKSTPRNNEVLNLKHESTTSLSGLDEDRLEDDRRVAQDGVMQMLKLFPPPQFDQAKENFARQSRNLFIWVSTGVALVTLCLFLVATLFNVSEPFGRTSWKGVAIRTILSTVLIAIPAVGSIFFLSGVLERKARGIWDSEVWEAERQEGKMIANSMKIPESAQWLNSLIASVWPLINPDLFTSLADRLEDVMQASLPKTVRMVSVEDLGQGSESIRILGVRWLPSGAATESVTSEGKVQSSEESKEEHGKEAEDQGAETMEAEEGDFINLELGFSYRARAEWKGLKNRSKQAHLYLAFYLPGNIKFPVWVELRGIVGIMRVRLQLTPDPPFFSLATITFLGQPKVDLSCVPLMKKGLNIMDLPLISNFVQSAVDAATAEYVAPKSLTLDLKDMIVGDDFKKDTSARGVMVIRIIRAFDFKQGDAGFGPFKEGSSDAYISVGWAKFGKPLWSTRVIQTDMEPWWDETAYVLVTPEELNVNESLRIQLWDSDRLTADDDLGRIELDLKTLMRDHQTSGKMCDRSDGFRALKKGHSMPGKLEWSIGYYSKTRLLDSQIAQQDDDTDIKSMKQLEEKVEAESKGKLQEAKRNEKSEFEQQKAQDMKAMQDDMIGNVPPPEEYPSGILSIQIHQITNLELEATNKNQTAAKESRSDETEEGDDLPSGYCTIILNHSKIFRTRTKPKNSKPFFNAGCERFIRNWKTTELHVSVRDSRVHEDDALMGVVYLPLAHILKRRSQVSEFFPLAGGVGFGRIRISLVFRSVQLQSPRQMLGWDYVTCDISSGVKVIDGCEGLENCKIKFRTNAGKGKMKPSGQVEDKHSWETRKKSPIMLAVRKRYSTALLIKFQLSSTFADKTPAFAVLWLKDVADEEDQSFQLSVWKGDVERAIKCSMPEYGQRVGTIEMHMKLWSGLSGCHAGLASNNPNLEDIMEVLDCTNASDDVSDTGPELDANDSSDSDSDSEGDEESLSNSGSRGPIREAKEYRNNAKDLHRKHKGMMQWKGPRTLQWLKHKAEHGGQRVEGLFKHHDRNSGFETEV
ncbi:hypothetical protein P152DRAFT_464558 [Eremomyces bilateralis CBS 781.70]|uniref:Meiotically up-regulated gene 190 protein n=1 Tax=Eremomyces bilateralis CBS 781.70 TaxID=1392243 RepID=A0A6G1GD51_9PEZI|nr:uncharacterized protein P152DRAFT_464558 [Eremomyces bilateralis CBS 781.70]KAF1815836.1 hypothetical protein P152DRAFT_464558 [Eremomyces bilateralis CBS 781.70]